MHTGFVFIKAFSPQPFLTIKIVIARSFSSCREARAEVYAASFLLNMSTSRVLFEIGLIKSQTTPIGLNLDQFHYFDGYRSVIAKLSKCNPGSFIIYMLTTYT